MTQLLVAHVKLKMILKLIQKFNPCMNSVHLHLRVFSATTKHHGFNLGPVDFAASAAIFALFSIVVLLLVKGLGMNISAAVNQWNPRHILDAGNVLCQFGMLILNQPINIPRDFILSLWNKASVRLTVDGGANRWFHFVQGTDCIAPDFITGDMDSVQQSVLTYFTSKGAEVIPTPDQNETDFTKALRHIQTYITSKNVQQLSGVIAVCETSGRLDQILANLNSLYKAKDILGNIPVYQLAKESLTWLLLPGSHQINVGDMLVRTGGAWCSLVPLGAQVEHVTTTGLKWNLNNQVLEFGRLISTSNTYSGDPVVTVETSGTLVWSMGVCDGAN